MTGHRLRFKTKAEKRKAEEDERKEDTEAERSCSSPRLLPDPVTELQEQSEAQQPL